MYLALGFASLPGSLGAMRMSKINAFTYALFKEVKYSIEFYTEFL